MKFFNKLENKFRKYAIRNLMYYIIIMYGIGFALMWIDPTIYSNYLCLNAKAILQGQVWRLVTFLIYPPSSSPFFGLLMIYVYYSLGTRLEQLWGAFRFNVYFFMGVIGHIIAALLAYLVFGELYILTTEYLNFSIFLAYALIFPEQNFYIMFVLPIKAKWLAVAEVAIYAMFFITGGAVERCEILLALANVLIFFFITRDYNRFNPKEIKRKRTFQTQIKQLPQGKSHHKCAVCGKTEKDGDNLEFRYCSKCEGSYEYCSEHLYTHRHVENSAKKQ